MWVSLGFRVAVAVVLAAHLPWPAAAQGQGPAILAPAPAAPPVPRAAPTIDVRPEAVRPSGPTVGNIVVEGTRRIESDTVLSYLYVKVGDPFDPSLINQSLKTLFSTGLFADVTLRREGDTLVVRVVENPIINRIAFEGNKRINDEILTQEVQLRPRIVYTRTRVQNDVQRILDIYRRSGRFAASVEPKVIQLPQNRVDLVFEITEGPVTGIKKISFIGNEYFDDGELQRVIQTKESRWYRFLTNSDTYDPDKLTFDRELLRRAYLEAGFADFRVVSAVAELSDDRADFFITFTVEEGERYIFGTMDVVSKIRDVEAEPLKAFIELEPGDWYNADEVDRTVAVLADAVADQGYAFVDVLPIVERDRETKTINITFEVQKGPRVYVERIDIRGNVRTLDKVIRREFRLVEGDAFSASKLRRSRQRISNLGFFGAVDVNNVPGSSPDKTIIQVDVEETSTGELTIGAGISTADGALGDIALRERNLLGKGQDLRLSFTLAQKRQNLDFSFTEPYFLDREIRAGFDVFHTRRDNDSESSFRSKATGTGIRFGYSITDDLTQRLRYTLRRDEVIDVYNNAALSIREEEGSRVTSGVGQDLRLGRLNSRIDPTDGYYGELSTDLAGLGGSVKYAKAVLRGAYYYPFTEEIVGAITGQGGFITGINDDVSITDRFFLGGDNLRGFKDAGAGPRDTQTEDSLGGNNLITGTAEVVFPLGLPSEFGISGAVFTDAGTLWTVDNASNVDDTASLRWSAGAGVAWKSPFGPVRVDLAKAIIKEDFDETEAIRFRFGTRF